MAISEGYVKRRCIQGLPVSRYHVDDWTVAEQVIKKVANRWKREGKERLHHIALGEYHRLTQYFSTKEYNHGPPFPQE